jgi:hypothetical protein
MADVRRRLGWAAHGGRNRVIGIRLGHRWGNRPGGAWGSSARSRPHRRRSGRMLPASPGPADCGPDTGCSRQPRRDRAGALGNKSSFEVGDRAEHVENELAGGGRGINLFFDRNQSDAAGFELIDGFRQLAQGSAEAVETTTQRASPSRAPSNSACKSGRSRGRPEMTSSTRTTPACWRRR